MLFLSNLLGSVSFSAGDRSPLIYGNEAYSISASELSSLMSS